MSCGSSLPRNPPVSGLPGERDRRLRVLPRSVIGVNLGLKRRILHAAQIPGLIYGANRRRSPEIGDSCGAAVAAVYVVIVSHDVPAKPVSKREIGPAASGPERTYCRPAWTHPDCIGRTAHTAWSPDSSGRPPPSMFTDETLPVSVAYKPSALLCCDVLRPAEVNAETKVDRMGSLLAIPKLVAGSPPGPFQ